MSQAPRYPSHGPGVQYIQRNGQTWAWPAYNGLNPRHLNYNFEHSRDWEAVAGLLPHGRRRVCIQAGGSIGIWAKGLAETFDTVYTFEPHPDLYACLVRNVEARNVIKLQAVLGTGRGRVGMGWKSFGSHTVNMGSHDGPYPRMKIDDLQLDACDAIFLDVEGYELFALSGGRETIKKHQPIIQVEEIGAEERHLIPVGSVERWLVQEMGYSKADKVGDDRIYLPPTYREFNV